MRQAARRAAEFFPEAGDSSLRDRDRLYTGFVHLSETIRAFTRHIKPARTSLELAS
jgi:hypothetical protein